MKIQSLEFTNFKGIGNFQLPLNGKSTVIFGENGCGKSSVLESINILFCKLIPKFTQGAFRPYDMFDLQDITFGKGRARIDMELNLEEETFYFFREILNRRKRSLIAHKLEKKFKDTYILEPSENMPIFVSYGTQRAVQVANIKRIKIRHEFDKINAFDNAIEKSVDFRMFFEWFRNQQEIEYMQKVELQDLQYEDEELKFVKSAILNFLGTSFTDLKISKNPLRFTAEKNGENLRIEQLSDGEKCVIALIGDLARRLVIANPSRENRLNGEGIVLIDEIELHLHPKWQSDIFQKLRMQFPNIQFIITTHSPKVLQTINDDVNLFYAHNEEQQIQFELKQLLHGWRANDVYELFMDTPSMASSTQLLLDEITQLVDKEAYEEAQEKIDFLESLTDDKNEDVVIMNAKLGHIKRKALLRKRGKSEEDSKE